MRRLVVPDMGLWGLERRHPPHDAVGLREDPEVLGDRRLRLGERRRGRGLHLVLGLKVERLVGAQPLQGLGQRRRPQRFGAERRDLLVDARDLFEADLVHLLGRHRQRGVMPDLRLVAGLADRQRPDALRLLAARLGHERLGDEVPVAHERRLHLVLHRGPQIFGEPAVGIGRPPRWHRAGGLEHRPVVDGLGELTIDERDQALKRSPTRDQPVVGSVLQRGDPLPDQRRHRFVAREQVAPVLDRPQRKPLVQLDRAAHRVAVHVVVPLVASTHLARLVGGKPLDEQLERLAIRSRQRARIDRLRLRQELAPRQSPPLPRHERAVPEPVVPVVHPQARGPLWRIPQRLFPRVPQQRRQRLVGHPGRRRRQRSGQRRTALGRRSRSRCTAVVAGRGGVHRGGTTEQPPAQDAHHGAVSPHRAQPTPAACARGSSNRRPSAPSRPRRGGRGSASYPADRRARSSSPAASARTGGPRPGRSE